MIVQALITEHKTLLNIWEKSVRATHDFLREEDLKFYKPLILNEYFHQVNLFCHKNRQLAITGFMGIASDKLEMLFIDPALRGRGIGRELLIYAIAEQKVKRVDVNEQNDQAVGFYQHMGFAVVNRSELDGTGNPYPLLHMELQYSTK